MYGLDRADFTPTVPTRSRPPVGTPSATPLARTRPTFSASGRAPLGCVFIHIASPQSRPSPPADDEAPPPPVSVYDTMGVPSQQKRAIGDGESTPWSARRGLGAASLNASASALTGLPPPPAMSPAQSDPFYQRGGTMDTVTTFDDRWVTVFGFPPSSLGYVLSEFGALGEIATHKSPSGPGNWVHVMYRSRLQAQRALSKHGKVFGGRLMLGVLPCLDDVAVGGAEKGGEFSASTGVAPVGAPIFRHSSAKAEIETDSGFVPEQRGDGPRRAPSWSAWLGDYLFGW